MAYPSATLLTIGSELLKGSVLNTNAMFLGRELLKIGFDVNAQVACHDDIGAIRQRLEQAHRHARIVIVSGGLGPTPDDVTREAFARYFNVPLVLSRSQFALIKKHYKHRGRKVPALVKKEALYPKGAVPLLNPTGIALGFSIFRNGRLTIALPGVPRELEKMFSSRVVPLIHRRFKKRRPRPALVCRTVGCSEPTVMRKLGRDFFDDPFEFGIYPLPGEVMIRMDAASQAIIRRCRQKAAARLAPYLYALEDTDLAETVGRLLAQKKKTISVAESCTGGLLSAALTRHGGASRYYRGGITAYSNSLKEKVGVARKLLREKGAVSAEVAAALAAGVRERLGTDFGIGVTGIAGPSGGRAQKPVGLVYLALSSKKKTQVYQHHMWGDRGQVQSRTVIKALEYLWRALSVSRKRG